MKFACASRLRQADHHAARTVDGEIVSEYCDQARGRFRVAHATP
jgi:hypothetical protein